MFLCIPTAASLSPELCLCCNCSDQWHLRPPPPLIPLHTNIHTHTNRVASVHSQALADTGGSMQNDTNARTNTHIYEANNGADNDFLVVSLCVTWFQFCNFPSN